MGFKDHPEKSFLGVLKRWDALGVVYSPIGWTSAGAVPRSYDVMVPWHNVSLLMYGFDAGDLFHDPDSEAQPASGHYL